MKCILNVPHSGVGRLSSWARPASLEAGGTGELRSSSLCFALALPRTFLVEAGKLLLKPLES